MKYKILNNSRDAKLKALYNNLSPNNCLSGEQWNMLREVVKETIDREFKEKLERRKCLDLD